MCREIDSEIEISIRDQESRVGERERERQNKNVRDKRHEGPKTQVQRERRWKQGGKA